RGEIVRWCQRGAGSPTVLRQAPRLGRTGWLALVFLLVLSLAVARGTPVLGILYQPAYASLWLGGISQDDHPFDWIDNMNYHVTYRVSTPGPHGITQLLDPTSLFPRSLRAMLLQSYVYNVRWMRVPAQHRTTLKYSILSRLAQRFCQRQTLATPV